MASIAPQAVGGTFLTLPAQLRMASISLKFFPWLGVLCACYTRPSYASYCILELFMTGTPPQSHSPRGCAQWSLFMPHPKDCPEQRQNQRGLWVGPTS